MFSPLGSHIAYTWSFENRSLGAHKLSPPFTSSNSSMGSGPVDRATAVALSPCGNFGIVGHSSGKIYKYNMQSGLYNGSFPHELKKGLKMKSKSMQLYNVPATPAASGTHTGSISGLVVGSLNRTLISAGLDCTIRFWDFDKQVLEMTIDVPSPVAMLAQHRDSELIAVACDDTIIR